MQRNRAESRSALASRNFRIYLGGTIFSMVGIWIQRLAIGWHAWELSESAFAVGLVAAVQFLPVLILTPFFGVLVDRIRAQTGMIVSNLLMGVVATTLGVITLHGSMSIELLTGLALLHGLLVSFYSPTRLALIPDLVPNRLFPSAVAITSIAFNLSRFIGPTLAGLVIAFWGLGWAYVINALSYFPVLLSLFLLNIDHASKPPRVSAPYFEQLLEGLLYTRDHLSIRGAILIAAVGAFFGRAVLELMPAYTGMVFRGGSTELAVLMSAAGVGAIAASFYMSSSGGQRKLRRLLSIGGVGIGLSIFLLGVSRQFYLGILAVTLLGACCTLVGVASQSLVQMRVEDRLRGRVLSLWSLVAIGSPAIGSLLGGAMLHSVGAVTTSVIYSICCFLLILLVRASLGARQPAPGSGSDEGS